jgi:hypothetical protein
MEVKTWILNGNLHYKKMRLFKRPTWPKCPHWPKGMCILTIDLGHEKHMLHLTKMTFLTKCQAKDLAKVDNCPWKWPWFNQIGHLDLIFNQIDHYDLALSQMNHTYLMI